MGNHGLQQLKNGKIIVDPQIKKYIPIIKEVNEILQKKLDTCTGFSFDYKKLSLTVHYRACSEDYEAKKKILKTINDLNLNPFLKIIEGRKLIEIRPAIGHNKGTILQEFILENHIKQIIYLGDDTNDIDAFNKLKELTHQKIIQGINIAVDSNETPDYVKNTADFYVKNINETYSFLKWLCHGNTN